MRRSGDLWRVLGAAVSAILLAVSQLNPNPLPAWVFPVVGAIALLAVAVPFIIARRRRD